MRPVGAIVGLYYDGVADVAVNHVLETPTGRRYLILELRRQERGKHTGRAHLQCLVIDEVPRDATVHPLLWYKRSRSRGRR